MLLLLLAGLWGGYYDDVMPAHAGSSSAKAGTGWGARVVDAARSSGSDKAGTCAGAWVVDACSAPGVYKGEVGGARSQGVGVHDIVWCACAQHDLVWVCMCVGGAVPQTPKPSSHTCPPGKTIGGRSHSAAAGPLPCQEAGAAGKVGLGAATARGCWLRGGMTIPPAEQVCPCPWLLPCMTGGCSALVTSSMTAPQCA